MSTECIVMRCVYIILIITSFWFEFICIWFIRYQLAEAAVMRLVNSYPGYFVLLEFENGDYIIIL